MSESEGWRESEGERGAVKEERLAERNRVTEQGIEVAERDRLMAPSHSKLPPQCLLPRDVSYLESVAAGCSSTAVVPSFIPSCVT